MAGRANAGKRWGMADDPALDLLHRHYELGLEERRLDEALGSVEFARTLDVAARVLPLPPGVVADIGGGPGRYALELAGRGTRSSTVTSCHCTSTSSARRPVLWPTGSRRLSVTPGTWIWTTTASTGFCSSGRSTTWSNAIRGSSRWQRRCGWRVRAPRCW